MNVEVWKSAKFACDQKVENWEEVYSRPQNLMLVETQEEYDFFWVMQLVYGCEIRVQFLDRDIGMRKYRMDAYPGHVYTTWEPADRNRI